MGRIGPDEAETMLDKLEFFIALAKERHFGRAAETLGVTQPTLSAAIKQLEDQLGVMLVLRGSRFQGLTPEGEQVLAWARRIAGDARSMREEMRAARHGLSGRIRIAAIPTALAMVARLTTPFREKHPGVTFSVLSRTSIEVLSLLGNFDIDAGITYLDHEPLGRVTSVPLYSERYQLIIAAGSPLAERKTVRWAHLAQLPLCLLTPDMQNRRIIDQHLAEAGIEVRPTLESNSMIVLFSHIRTGKWASIMPLNLAETFGFDEPIRAIPIVEPDASHLVGLVAARREPHTPLVAALLDEAVALAEDFSRGRSG
jgi:DNA-binding transcriptional LysR family regulator